MVSQHDVLFLSHGGGPLPLLGDTGHDEMVNCLRNIAGSIRKPGAIIVISAHWEETIPAITSGANPSLIYDYHGFPQAAYNIGYPCPGAPLLANKIHAALASAGIPARLDAQRGFDHGVFVPLRIMYPAADISCVQLSLAGNLDPALHIAIGQALRSLDHDNVLVIGSGFTFHNMQAFMTPDTGAADAMNVAFEHWLEDTCCNPSLTETERAQRLVKWADAPAARFCHPREEHLLPLHVCCGLAGRHCSHYFALQVLGKKTSMYLWHGSNHAGS